MRILGIESSCDETAVAVVEDGRLVLANCIASSLSRHQVYGGVVPEIAAREHCKVIVPLVQQALSTAKIDWSEVDAVAYTRGPGLISSLLIGAVTARTLAHVFQKPLIPVNHIAGHIYSNWLYEGDDPIAPEPLFPILILTVSGGHNELVYMKDHHDFTVLGETLDDAAGEAFDKVSRILGLGFPGGPIISKLAKNGNPQAFHFSRALMNKDHERNLNFSFSGLKTAVLYAVKDLAEISEAQKADVAASFQEAVCDSLVTKLLWALEEYPDVQEIHLAGGVSANQRLREMLQLRLAEKSPTFQLRIPLHMSYCTDNAAMIAGAGYYCREKVGWEGVGV